MVKNPPAMQETQYGSSGWEDPLEKGMATHSIVLAWRIPWQRSLVGHSPWGHKELDTTEATERRCTRLWSNFKIVGYCCNSGIPLELFLSLRQVKLKLNEVWVTLISRMKNYSFHVEVYISVITWRFLLLVHVFMIVKLSYFVKKTFFFMIWKVWNRTKP